MNIRDTVMSSQAMAGRVRRYHTWATIQTETIAEHSWRVATLYVELFGMPLRAEILYFILHHDSCELTTGDLPFPVKKLNPVLGEAIKDVEKQGFKRIGVRLPEIHEHTRAQIKICDLLQMAEFGVSEVNMGNKYAIPIVLDTVRAALSMAEELDVQTLEVVHDFIEKNIQPWVELTNEKELARV